MLHRALEQFILDVHFGALDVLLLDLPPGTGDIAISMAQLLPNAELILVSTPQHAAVDVAERAGTLSLQTQQKVVGVIENMAAMTLPDGTVLEMFGSGGGEHLATRLTEALDYSVPLLGSVPLDVALRTGGDEGMPVVWGYPESATSVEIKNIAAQLLHRKDSLAGKPLSLIV
jgi:mrp protein